MESYFEIHSPFKFKLMFSQVTSNNDFEGMIQIPLLKRSEMKRKLNMIITEELKKILYPKMFLYGYHSAPLFWPGTYTLCYF